MHPSVNRANKLAKLLDSQFEILGIRFGIDPLLSLIPGLGDIVANVLGIYIILVAYEVGVPFVHILRMIFHVVIDALIGAIPIVGDIFDVYYKANMRNIRILKENS